MAGFGCSIGDIVALGNLAWNVYKACRNASSEFQEVAREVISLHAAVKELEEEASKPDSVVTRTGEQKQKELNTLVSNIGLVLAQLERLVSKYNSLGTADRRKRDVIRFSAEGLEDIRSKIMLHTSAINLFLGSLSVASLGRIESKLDEIVKELQRGERDTSTIAVSDDEEDPSAQAQWRALRKELVDDGFQRDDVDSHKAWIKAKLRDRIVNRQNEPPEGTEPRGHETPQEEHSASGHGLEEPVLVHPQARSRGHPLINLPPPPPSEGSITPKSSGSSLHSTYVMDNISTVAVNDGNVGRSWKRNHDATQTLEAERADRRSQLVDLEHVFKSISLQKVPSSADLPDLTPLKIDERRASEPYSPPPPKLRRSPSISSMTSIHSDVSEHDSNGNLTKRTITTTTTTYFSASASDSAVSDTGYDPMASRTLPRPGAFLGAPLEPPAPQSLMGQFSTKISGNTQKKHKCKVCDKYFTRPWSLRTHMYSHTGEKPFACDVEGCGRHFSVVSNLRRHRKVHKGQGYNGQDSDADSEL